MVQDLTAHAARRTGLAAAAASWAAAGRTWIVAVGYDTGRRVAFGRGGAPQASLPEAVTASCSIPAPAASLVTAGPRTTLERIERVIRRWMTFALRREAARLRSAGVKVTLLTPGPEDLHAIGANLMDPGRPRDVFETSLRTSARSLPARCPA